MLKCECDSLYCTACYPLYTPEETRAYYLGVRHTYANKYLQDLETLKELNNNEETLRKITKLKNFLNR